MIDGINVLHMPLKLRILGWQTDCPLQEGVGVTLPSPPVNLPSQGWSSCTEPFLDSDDDAPDAAPVPVPANPVALPVPEALPAPPPYVHLLLDEASGNASSLGSSGELMLH
jgi:hypothetical protein